MAFSIVSYNVLADAYIRAERYPKVAAALLSAPERARRIVLRIVALNADIICLQEMEPAVYDALGEALGTRFESTLALKPGGKPDGCATFVRRDRFSVNRTSVFAFPDARDSEPESGHIALVLGLDHEGRDLAVANTHLRWGPAGAAPGDQWATRQLALLLESRPRLAPGGTDWILCGDFNVTPESAAIALLREAGFKDAYGADGPPTCVTGDHARRIDYLFIRGAFRARPHPLRQLDSRSILPSETEPSDHIPIGASLELAD